MNCTPVRYVHHINSGQKYGQYGAIIKIKSNKHSKVGQGISIQLHKMVRKERIALVVTLFPMLYVTSDLCLFQILWTIWNECLTEAQLALVTLEVLIQGFPQGRILLQGVPLGSISLQGVLQG